MIKSKENLEKERNSKAWRLWFNKYHDSVCPHRTYTEHTQCDLEHMKETGYVENVRADEYLLLTTDADLEYVFEGISREHHVEVSVIKSQFKEIKDSLASSKI